VLTSANLATSLTVRSTQMPGLVACLTPQQQQEEDEQELVDWFDQEELDQMRDRFQQLLRNFDAAASSMFLTTTTISSSNPTAASSSTTTTTTSSSSNSRRSTNSSSAAGGVASDSTLPAAEPRGPSFKRLIVTGPIYATTIQHLEQLLDLLPGTQHLQEVLFIEELEGAVCQAFVKALAYVKAVHKFQVQGPGTDQQQLQPSTTTSSSSSSTTTTSSSDRGGGGSSSRLSGHGTVPDSTSSGWRNSCHTLAMVPSPRGRHREFDLSDLRPLLGQQLRTLLLVGVPADRLWMYDEPLRSLQTLQLLAVGSWGPRALAGAARLTNLRHFGMGGSVTSTSIAALPAAFTALVHLVSLDLTSMELTQEVLEGVCNMTRLCQLDLSSTRGFTTLPHSISNLISLKTLMLQTSSVGSLPESMSALTALKGLAWSQKAATAPLALDVVWRLRGLTALRIMDHHLAAVPAATSQLGSLRSLHLCGQALAVLPSSMSALAELESLCLIAPRLRVLPEAITALTRLKELAALGVVLQQQTPAVQAFLAQCQAKGCQLKLAPSNS
jgi:hypothetical protein